MNADYRDVILSEAKDLRILLVAALSQTACAHRNQKS
jgi:hypothetical protein